MYEIEQNLCPCKESRYSIRVSHLAGFSDASGRGPGQAECTVIARLRCDKQLNGSDKQSKSITSRLQQQPTSGNKLTRLLMRIDRCHRSNHQQCQSSPQ